MPEAAYAATSEALHGGLQKLFIASQPRDRQQHVTNQVHYPISGYVKTKYATVCLRPAGPRIDHLPDMVPWYGGLSGAREVMCFIPTHPGKDYYVHGSPELSANRKSGVAVMKRY